MKQAIMVAPGKIEFRQVECPTALPEEVLIKEAIHMRGGKNPAEKCETTLASCCISCYFKINQTPLSIEE